MNLTSISRCISIVGMGCLACAGSTRAADTGLYFSANAGVNIIDDLTANTFPVVKVDFDPGFRFSAALGYTFYKNSSVAVAGEFESGVLYSEIDKASVGTLSAPATGEYWQIPFLANILVTFMPDSKWNPYIGFGGGGVYGDLTINGVQGDETDGAFQGMAGVKYQINENLYAGAGYKALVTFPDGLEKIVNHSFTLAVGANF